MKFPLPKTNVPHCKAFLIKLPSKFIFPCFENPKFFVHCDLLFDIYCLQADMKKRRRVEPYLSAFDRFLAQTKLFENCIFPFCDDQDLANLASTCKAAVPALYVSTEERSWRISTLFSRNSTWSMFPARLAYVRFLIIDVGFTRLPRGLSGVERVEYNANVPLLYAMFPAGLKYLSFDLRFNVPPSSSLPVVSSLPSSLVELEFNGTFSRVGLRAGLLPNGLRILKIGVYPRQLRKRVLPPSLLNLKIGSYDSLLAKGVLPASLVTLDLNGYFIIEEGSLQNLNALTRLDLGAYFNQPLQHGMFPSGLIGLSLGESFDKPLEAAMLPTGLRALTVGYQKSEAMMIRLAELRRAMPHLIITQIFCNS
jgi:hypothetical protein